MTPERLDEIRQHLSCSVSRSTDWWEQACRELLEHLDHPVQVPAWKSDPEEYRRLEVIRGWVEDPIPDHSPRKGLQYLLALLDGRDHLIHDLSLDAQWAADAERGRIVAWLREPTRKCSRCAGQGRVRDPVPYGDTSPCPDCHGSLRPSLEAAADDLEAQGTPEPLPADLLRKRVAVLEGALVEIVNECKITSLHPENKVLHCENLARRALEGRT